MPSIDAIHSGAGDINMNGVDFTAEIGASTQVSSIKQIEYVDEETGDITATTGTINLSGEYKGATFNIDQSAAKGTINLKGSMIAGAVTQAAGANMVIGGDSKTGALTLEGGTITFEFGASLTSASVEGLNKVEITVNLSDAALDDIKNGNGFDYELFTNSTGASLAGTTVNFVSESGNTASATVKQDANGKVTVGQLVPEPTTATLSLLALASLAARRRRK